MQAVSFASSTSCQLSNTEKVEAQQLDITWGMSNFIFLVIAAYLNDKQASDQQVSVFDFINDNWEFILNNTKIDEAVDSVWPQRFGIVAKELGVKVVSVVSLKKVSII